MALVACSSSLSRKSDFTIIHSVAREEILQQDSGVIEQDVQLLLIGGLHQAE